MEENDTVIKCVYSVTWKRCMEWLLESKVKPPRLFFTILWIMLGIAWIGLGITFEVSTPLYYFMVFFCIYRVALRDILMLNRQYRAMVKNFGQEEWLRTVVFEEDQIRMLEGNVTMNFNYSDIIDVKENENKIWLICQNKKVIRIYRDSFVDSNWEECRSLIGRKHSVLP